LEQCAFIGTQAASFGMTTTDEFIAYLNLKEPEKKEWRVPSLLEFFVS
jgi:hypothetical protein